MNSTAAKQHLNRFYIISALALIWNILGVIAYLGQVYMSTEIKNMLPPAEQAYYANSPAWVTGAFAIAVFSGTFGSLLLLFKKKLALFLFWLSTLAIIVQFIYNFLIQKDMVISAVHYIWPIIVFGISMFLIWFAKTSLKNGYIS
jgi:hypothetical protein